MARLSLAQGSRPRTVLVLNPGWLPVLAIMAWLGAVWQAPQAYPDLALQGRWLLGAALAVGALGSVAFREVLRFAIFWRGVLGDGRVRLLRLTLYPYGGTFHLSPSRLPWRKEAVLAAAGPAASAALALCFGALWLWGGQPFYSWLALFNLSLGLFSLAPAQPLDGARLLEALSHKTRLERPRLARMTFHAGDLLAASCVWLGGLTLLLAQYPPGLLLVAVGFLLQLHEEPAPEPDLEQQRLLNRYSVRDVVQSQGSNGAGLPPERGPGRPARLPLHRPGALSLRPERGGSDGSALPLREGPSLRSRVIPITAELGAAWAKLHEQNAQTLLVVDDYRIVGVCSRRQLLAYLRARADQGEKESE